MIALRLLGGASALSLLVAALPASAETTTVSGRQLVVTDTLTEDLVISPDPTLSGKIRISMDGSIACVSTVGGETAVIGTSGCSDEAGRLRIDIPPDMPVTLTSNSNGDIHLGDLRALLVASLNSTGDMTAGHTGGLVLAIRGNADATMGTVDGPASVEIASSGDVRLHQVKGPLTVKQVSSGDLVVGGIDSDSVTLQGSGSGDMLIGGGHIGSLNARMMSSGDLSLAASIRDADIEASGTSDVKLGPVSGTLVRHAIGRATIVVGGTDLMDRLTRDAARRATRSSSGATWSGSSGSSVHLWMLTAAFAALVTYICARIIHRNGGLGRGGLAGGGLAGTTWRRTAPTPTPSSPGVAALNETLARLDQRLGRLETYVTTKEFDLNRKFREMGRQ